MGLARQGRQDGGFTPEPVELVGRGCAGSRRPRSSRGGPRWSRPGAVPARNWFHLLDEVHRLGEQQRGGDVEAVRRAEARLVVQRERVVVAVAGDAGQPDAVGHVLLDVGDDVVGLVPRALGRGRDVALEQRPDRQALADIQLSAELALDQQAGAGPGREAGGQGGALQADPVDPVVAVLGVVEVEVRPKVGILGLVGELEPGLGGIQVLDIDIVQDVAGVAGVIDRLE